MDHEHWPPSQILNIKHEHKHTPQSFPWTLTITIYFECCQLPHYWINNIDLKHHQWFLIMNMSLHHEHWPWTLTMVLLCMLQLTTRLIHVHWHYPQAMNANHEHEQSPRTLTMNIYYDHETCKLAMAPKKIMNIYIKHRPWALILNMNLHHKHLRWILTITMNH